MPWPSGKSGSPVGEPPVARGYTPSIYAMLPKLLERSGKFGTGSITGIYTVLVEGDDTNEPISDTVRGILDGHIVLSVPSRCGTTIGHRRAGERQPLMSEIVDARHKEIAENVRKTLSVYYENIDLISIGAYKAGTNPAIDYAVGVIDAINGFLTQGTKESFTYEETLSFMEKALKLREGSDETV